MPQKSAGLLLYRFNNTIEFLIVHPGGPFWAKKDLGAWSIPKGEFEDNESPLEAATREFEEEMGEKISGNFITLTPVKMKSGKTIYAFALEHDFDTSKIKSNSFTIEWPPKSGKMQSFPEIDRGGWFNAETCKSKLNESQVQFIEELQKILDKRN
jgi:predicted NUDIX family NTP pyrophosphohydrolase